MASFDNLNALSIGFQRKESTATLQRRVSDSPAFTFSSLSCTLFDNGVYLRRILHAKSPCRH